MERVKNVILEELIKRGYAANQIEQLVNPMPEIPEVMSQIAGIMPGVMSEAPQLLSVTEVSEQLLPRPTGLSAINNIVGEGQSALRQDTTSNLLSRLPPEQLSAVEKKNSQRYRHGAALPSRPQTMTPVRPGLRDRAEMFLGDVFGGTPVGRRRRNMFMNAAEIIPGTGEALLFSDAEQARQQGDLISAGILSGGALLSTVPVAGPVISKAARRAAMGVGKARNRVASGQYVGAPAGVDTPQKLGATRKRYKDLAELGEAGQDWYTDASNWIGSVSNDSDVARQINANALGITSQGTGVDSNLGFAIKGINQSAAGWPVRTGRFPDIASPKIEASISGTSSDFGPKIDPFARNLSVSWNPSMANYPVHDIWDGRAFGFRGPATKKYPEGAPWDQGFSPQQHAWMDEQSDAVIQQLAQEGKTYDPLTLQASAWTGAKIDAGELVAEDAAKHYGDFVPKYQASATYEQIPGQGTGHLKGIVNRPFAAREDYSNLASWTDPRGRDSLYSSTGMMVEPSIDSLGVFTPQGARVTEFNPANVARPLTQSSAFGVLDPDKQLLSTVEGARAYIDAQNAGAWHRVVPQGTAGQKTGLQIELGRPVTPSELRELKDLADQQGFIAVDYGDGVRFLNNTDSALGKHRITEMSAPRSRFGATERSQLEVDINQIVSDSSVTRQRIESDYIDFETNLQRSMEGSGAATEQLFEILDNNPTIRDSIEAEAMRKAQTNLARDADFAADNNLPVREDMQNARRIFVGGGWDALRAAYLRGDFVPAIIGAILAPSFFGEDQEL